eukprot:NODE_878_length_1138_cov_152.029674_g836_i0.p1 GENE.NODE_878_length_1138_cov_152.029674_g836_i0~~NODE_878_length_1138_cov_152.029674_g836_i0.p1  ORF type:complete len:284 (+),score=33.78 NODE_878_length_1138_cov_152.029674_g836_i0:72-854(+)
MSGDKVQGGRGDFCWSCVDPLPAPVPVPCSLEPPLKRACHESYPMSCTTAPQPSTVPPQPSTAPPCIISAIPESEAEVPQIPELLLEAPPCAPIKKELPFSSLPTSFPNRVDVPSVDSNPPNPNTFQSAPAEGRIPDEFRVTDMVQPNTVDSDTHCSTPMGGKLEAASSLTSGREFPKYPYTALKPTELKLPASLTAAPRLRHRPSSAPPQGEMRKSSNGGRPKPKRNSNLQTVVVPATLIKNGQRTTVQVQVYYPRSRK